MIILSYGMQRSGSTLTYEIIRIILEENGFPQHILPNDIKMHDRNDNFVDEVSIKKLDSIQNYIGDNIICIKTHSPLSHEVHDYIKNNTEIFPVVIVSYRDPRDIGLSLLDSGWAARLKEPNIYPKYVLAFYRLTHRNPYKYPFANILDHGDALDLIESSIKNAGTYVNLPQAFLPSYEKLLSQFN